MWSKGLPGGIKLGAKQQRHVDTIHGTSTLPTELHGFPDMVKFVLVVVNYYRMTQNMCHPLLHVIDKLSDAPSSRERPFCGSGDLT